jgi:hypothetical protein
VPGEQLAQRRVVARGKRRDQLVIVHRFSIAARRGPVHKGRREKAMPTWRPCLPV